MKIAISSKGKDIKSEIDPRFGRCSYFLIAEIHNKKIESIKNIENTAAIQRGGAGISASQLMGNKNVDVLITGNVGPNAFEILKRLGIEIYQAEGIVEKVIQEFIKGDLVKIEEPWDMGKAS